MEDKLIDKTLVNFRVSWFRHWACVWTLLFFFSWSFLPSVSLAQQPTATMRAVSGTVLVNGQTQNTGTVLNAGDVIETQVGASVVLELSDGSLLELGEHTKIDLAKLTQMATGARVSLVKLLWGRIRARLSPGHQHAGSSFDIETPNAIVGVKFSEPDIEVSYSPDKVETIGLAHTVELMAKNLLTNEEILVPVGSTVIVVGTTVKIVAGILAIASASEAGTAGAGTASAATESAGTASTGSAATGSTSTSSAGMGTGTKVAIGVGAAAAAAGGVAALVLSGEEDGDSETAESSGDLSGNWVFSGSCIGYGCTEAIDTHPNPECLGLGMCTCCNVGGMISVTQTDNQLSGVSASDNFLNGTVEGNNVAFTITNFSLVMPLYQATDIFTGTLSGNTITGTLEGFGDVYTSGPDVPMTWDGTFTVRINK